MPIDADRKTSTGNFTSGTAMLYQQELYLLEQCRFILQLDLLLLVLILLEKRDITFLEEYISATTSTGTPKYYAMLDTGATGESSSNSGSIIVSPTPSATFAYKIHYNAAPALLENDDTNYISMNFPNGLLYCC